MVTELKPDLKLILLSSTPILDREQRETESKAKWEQKVAKFDVDLVQKVTTTGTTKELMKKWILGYPPQITKVQENSASSDLKGNYTSTQFNCKNSKLYFPKFNIENINGWLNGVNCNINGRTGMYNCTTVRCIILKNDIVGNIKKMEKRKVYVFVSAVDIFASEQKERSLLIVLSSLKIMQKLNKLR